MRYVVTRLGVYLVAVWGSLTINFLLPRLAPGDPAATLLARMSGELTPEQIDSLKTVYGLTSNGNLLSQYGTYLNQLAHGNLGISVTYFPSTVTSVIGSAIVWTLLLGIVALTIGFAVGVSLGIVVAWRRAGVTDSVLTPFFVFEV